MFIASNQDFAQQDDENSVRKTTILFAPSPKAMNVLLGPLFDVAGYAFAAAAVLAPFSGFNIVTGIDKSKQERVFFSEKLVN